MKLKDLIGKNVLLLVDSVGKSHQTKGILEAIDSGMVFMGDGWINISYIIVIQEIPNET